MNLVMSDMNGTQLTNFVAPCRYCPTYRNVNTVVNKRARGGSGRYSAWRRPSTDSTGKHIGGLVINLRDAIVVRHDIGECE